MGNTIPEPHTEDGLPGWAIGVLVAAIVVTVVWVILLIALVIYLLTKSRNDQPAPISRTYQPTKTLTVPGDSMVIAAPHAKDVEGSHTTPSPTPPVAAIATTLQPPASSQEDLMQVHLEQTEDEDENEEQTTYDKPRPVSIAVHAESKEDGSGAKEFHLQVNKESPPTASGGSTGDDELVQSSTTLQVNTEDSAQAKYDSGAEELEDERSSTDSAKDNALVGMVLSRPVTIRQLGATLREPGYLESEFRKLPANVVNPDDIPPGAEKKNRYSNVLPTTKTRVPLSLQFARPNSDYINANFVRGYRNHPKQYIATQGPMENTIEDFWRMIWEHSCEVIVMATNFQERGIDKCARYWPAQGSEEYGALEVTNEQQSTHFNFNTTVLSLKNLDTGDVRTVHHYRLTCWPTQGVPATSQPITDSLQEIKMADSAGPAVVHCSAGIGRTGVLIAIDIGIQALLQGDETVDVLRIISTLRQDRAGAILTRDQYRFVHQALYDVAREIGK